MSQANVELVKALQPTGLDMVEVIRDDTGGQPFEGDPDTAVFAGDFEVSFVPGSAGVLTAASYKGVDGLVEGWRDWLEAWASYRVDVEEFIDGGDEVVVLVRVRGRTARDDVLVDHSPGAVWTIRQGKVAAIRFYLDRDEALKAAGLKE